MTGSQPQQAATSGTSAAAAASPVMDGDGAFAAAADDLRPSVSSGALSKWCLHVPIELLTVGSDKQPQRTARYYQLQVTLHHALRTEVPCELITVPCTDHVSMSYCRANIAAGAVATSAARIYCRSMERSRMVT